MPYSMKVDGMEEISETLSKLHDSAPGVAARALYEGAHIMNEEIWKEMEKIKTAPFKFAKSGEKRLPSPEEKEALVSAGIGVAKFDKNGTEVNTSVGFNEAGYVNVKFKHMSAQARTNYKSYRLKGHDSNSTSFLRALGKSTKGLQDQKPLGVIANAINSGTSFMQKQPFVRKAANSGGKKALARMKEFIESEFDAMTKK